MNNKGFAITTLIYGLAIMGLLLISIIMSTVSSTRRNIKELSKQVEEELVNYNKTNVVYDGQSSGIKSFTVPSGQAGYYRFEVWGAQGTTGSNTCNGGLGAYTTGIIYLNENKTLYLYSGKCGEDSYVSVEENDDSTIIMKAASGGKKTNTVGGTLCSYYNYMNPNGGKMNANYELDSSNMRGTDYKENYFIPTARGMDDGDTAVCRNSTNNVSDGNGGYSIIASYPGGVSDAIVVSGVKYYFVDGLMLPGVNSGVGKISIQKLASGDGYQNMPKLNGQAWNGVNKIVVQTSGESLASNVCKLYYSAEGARQKIDIASATTSLDFPRGLNIDDISLLCKTNYDDVKNVKFTISLSNNSGTYQIYNGDYYNITPTGIKLSAYQPMAGTVLSSHGNYYLIPITSENKVLTSNGTGGIVTSGLIGLSSQKWGIDAVNAANQQYKLVEASSYRAMNVYDNSATAGEEVQTTSQFNTLSTNDAQIWRIVSNANATYSIQSIINSNYAVSDTTNNSIILGKSNSGNPTNIEKFIFYSLDFSTLSRG